MDKFRDIAYTYEYDNPFENDSQRILTNRLISYISSNSSIFMTNDYINKILFKNINPSLKALYGKDINNSIIENPIILDVKSFLKDISNQYSNIIPSDLKSWVNKKTDIENKLENEFKDLLSNESENNEPDEYEEDEYEDEDDNNDEKDDKDNKSKKDDIIKLDKNKFCYSMTEGITNYDISSEKLLGLIQVRELSVNIARSLLAKDVKIDYDIQKLETKKRKDLIVQIQKYRNIKKIAALLDDDIIDMSIDQLEICLEQCKKYHETFKLQEVIKSSFNGAKMVLSCFLPNGIKIGKKRVKFEGIGDELVSTLFDSTTVIGKSFDNMAQKYNFHINDDALVLLKIGETIIKGVKIENVEEPINEQTSNSNKALDKSLSNTINKQSKNKIINNNINRMPGTISLNDSIQTPNNYVDDESEDEDDNESEDEDETEDNESEDEDN